MDVVIWGLKKGVIHDEQENKIDFKSQDEFNMAKEYLVIEDIG